MIRTIGAARRDGRDSARRESVRARRRDGARRDGGNVSAFEVVRTMRSVDVLAGGF